MFSVALRLLIGTSVLKQVAANSQQSGLYRGQKQNIFFGNFKPDKGHKLSSTKISSPLVTDVFDCTLNCIIDSRCNSFNFAVNQDVNKRHVCELLDTDKYRAEADDLQANGGFLHYSPWVIIIAKGALFVFSSSFPFMLRNSTFYQLTNCWYTLNYADNLSCRV